MEDLIKGSEQAALAALQRALASGSKLIIAGALSAVSAALIDKLFRIGIDLGPIKPPGVDLPLPPPIAVVALTYISGASAWAGWAYLRQAAKLMQCIEFDMGVESNEIQAALSGSSLASASVLLVRALCIIVILALGYTYSPIYELIFFGKEAPLSVFFILDAAIEVPYFLIAFDSRIRYFQPSNWDSTPFYARIIFYFSDRPRLEFPSESQIPQQLSKIDIVSIIGELNRIFLDKVVVITLNTLLRKFGYGIFFKFTDKAWDEQFMQTVDKQLDEILLRELPNADLDTRAAVKNFILGS